MVGGKTTPEPEGLGGVAIRVMLKVQREIIQRNW